MGFLKRYTPLKANPKKTAAWKRRTQKRLPAIGKKGKEWNAAKRKGDQVIKRLGITRCEFQYEGCTRDNFLGRAHYKKRRNLTHGELEEYAIACNSCHSSLEIMKESEMERIIKEVIANRRKLY